MKKVFIHGITAGIFAAIAAIVYNKMYSDALMVDFSKLINVTSISGSIIFGCILASVGYYFFSKLIKSNVDVWFNIIFLVITFASFISPLSATLPFEIESPELFAGLAIPMHIFPVLFWLATKPLFWKTAEIES
jgi:hypothetical protein